jgi:hypothetical protein
MSEGSNGQKPNVVGIADEWEIPGTPFKVYPKAVVSILKSVAASIVTVIAMLGLVGWAIYYWNLQARVAHAFDGLTAEQVKTLIKDAADGRLTSEQLERRLDRTSFLRNR